MIIVPTRRGFLTGLSALLTAPAIVRADSLMKISVPRAPIRIAPAAGIWRTLEFPQAAMTAEDVRRWMWLMAQDRSITAVRPIT